MRGLKIGVTVALAAALAVVAQPSSIGASAAANAWRTAAPIGLVPGDVAVVAAIQGNDGKAYFLRHCLHFACVPSSTEVYSAVSNAWKAVAAVPHTLPKGRQLAFAAALGSDGTIYAVGAGGLQDGTGDYPSNLLYAYSPTTNTWTQKASLPSIRGALGAAAGPNGLIYAVGGLIGDGICQSPQSVNVVDSYNPSTNTWSATSPLAHERDTFASVLGSDQRLYAIAGEDQVTTYPTPGNCSLATTNLSSVEAYSFTTHAWSSAANFPVAGTMIGAVLGSDGRIYALSGHGVLAAYNATLNTWSVLAAPPHGTAQPSAVVLGMSATRLSSGVNEVLILDDVCNRTSTGTSCTVKSYTLST